MKIKIIWDYILPATMMVISYAWGIWLLLQTIGREATIGVLLIGIGISVQNKRGGWLMGIKRKKDES